MQIKAIKPIAALLAMAMVLGMLAVVPAMAAGTEAAGPVITMNPADRTVSAGGTATFSIAASGDPVLTYTWYERDNGGIYQPLEEGGNRGLYSGVGTPRLTLSNVPASFNGFRYLCRVSNAQGHADSGAATLTVTATGAPIIISQPVDRRIYEGGSTTFSVTATGDPAPTYQWMFLDWINDNEWYNVTDGGVYSGSNTPVLTLTNVPASFNGRRYLCLVSGDNTRIDSNIARLTIVPPGSPIISMQPVSRSIVEGGTAQFTINAAGNPPPVFQWMYRDLENGDEWFNVIDGGGLYSGATTATLTVRNAKIEMDGYRYSCYVKNSVGNLQSAEVTLTVSEAAEAQSPITGPESLILEEGYATTSTEVYSVAGGPGVTVTKKSGDARITWNDMTRKLNIAEGLIPGIYIVTLAVSNVAGPELVFSFVLTVMEKVITDMTNFVAVNRYRRAQFTDVDETEWYGFDKQKTIVLAYEYGLMVGSSSINGMTFNPTGDVTIAEAITIAARVHSIYMTGKEDFRQGTPWYQVYVDYAIEKGIIVKDDFTDFTRAATRAEMVYIFASSLPEEELEERNTVNSLPDVFNDTIYSDYIFMLYEAGVISGGDEHGTFSPYNNITRAEAAAIISRIILPETRINDRTYSAQKAETGDREQGSDGEERQESAMPGQDPGREAALG